jgi:hypothetical protein
MAAVPRTVRNRPFWHYIASVFLCCCIDLSLWGIDTNEETTASGLTSDKKSWDSRFHNRKGSLR